MSETVQMKNEIILFDKCHLLDNATEYFVTICGFSGGKEQHKTLRERGEAVREKIWNSLEPKVILSSFDNKVIKGNTLNVEGVKIECNAVEQISAAHIRNFYLYVLTVGNMDYQGASVLDGLYADTWGTAFVEAARDELTKVIKGFYSSDGNDRSFISDSFGPGFYGMEVRQVESFVKALAVEKIGVKANHKGMLIPVKSCTGFYMVVNREESLPAKGCRSCSANSKGCQFCRVQNR